MTTATKSRTIRTSKVAKKLQQLDISGDVTSRILDHIQRARLARLIQLQKGLSAEEISRATGLHYNTVLKFLGTGSYTTLDPRTSTTFKIMRALGFGFQLVEK